MTPSTSTRSLLTSTRRFALSAWALRFFGLAIFAVILVRIDLGGVAETIKGARLLPIVGVLVLTLPFFVVKSYRWRYILRRYQIDVSNGQALRMYCAGLFVGQVTPGQLGEVVRARFLWTRGHDAVRATASVVVDRALDLVALVLVAIPGFGLVFGSSAALAMLIAVLALALAVVLLRPRRAMHGIAGHLGHRAQGVADRVDGLLAPIEQSMRKKADASVLALTTLAALGINLLRFYLLLVSLGLSLPIANFVFGVALANLMALLPITIFGVGTRDAALAMVFQQAGGTTEGAVAFSLMILGVAYMLNMAVGSIAWALETSSSK